MKKTKILIVSVNSKYIHSSPAPYCLKTAADSILPKDNFTTKTMQASINDTTEHIIHSIAKEKPDILGLCVYIWNVETVKKICSSIKTVNPAIKIILGGPEISYGIKHTKINENNYDMIVSGEGEYAFSAAVLYLSGIEIPNELNSHITGKTISCDLIKNLDDLGFIYNDKNIQDFDNKIIYYESSRGCPFSCAYCLSSVCGKVRFLSLERVFSDIDFFIRHNVKQVKFTDRTFNCSPQRAYSIWKYIYDNKYRSNTNFHFEIGADLLNSKQIELLAKMPDGKIQLEIGIQSTNRESLTESCRYAPNELIFNNVKQLTKNGNINIHTDLIAGLPYESFERFSQSFNQVYQLNAHQLQLGFLKLLSGAPLNGLIEKHGYAFTEYPPYEILKNNYISYDELQHLKEIEDVLEKYYNSLRFSLSLNEAEKYFSSPFDMYDKIAGFFKEKSLTFSSVSSKKLFDLLNEFLIKNNIHIEKTLLKDFYLSENSEVPPESLKHLIPLNKFTKPVSPALIKEAGLSNNKKVLVKFIENTAFFIDYSYKNPVNSRYGILCEKEVTFNE